MSLLFCVYPVGSVSSMVAGRLADAFGYDIDFVPVEERVVERTNEQ